MENLKRIYVKLFEGTYKNGKFFGSIYKDEKKKKKKKKIGDIEIEKQSHISIKIIDINKTVVSNEASFSKKDLNMSFGIKNQTFIYASSKNQCIQKILC